MKVKKAVSGGGPGSARTCAASAPRIHVYRPSVRLRGGNHVGEWMMVAPQANVMWAGVTKPHTVGSLTIPELVLNGYNYGSSVHT